MIKNDNISMDDICECPYACKPQSYNSYYSKENNNDDNKKYLKYDLVMKVYEMGRKNFLFHDTVKGATASAIVYTLAETAKVNGLNIRLYLETVMTKMLDYKNEPESILEDLMPWSEMMPETCSLNKHSEI